MSRATRTPQLPALPTVAESGYAGFEAANWYGILIRAATPRAIIDRLSTEINKAVQSTEYRDHIRRAGLDIAYLGPVEFDAYIRSEAERFARALKLLKPEID